MGNQTAVLDATEIPYRFMEVWGSLLGEWGYAYAGFI